MYYELVTNNECLKISAINPVDNSEDVYFYPLIYDSGSGNYVLSVPFYFGNMVIPGQYSLNFPGLSFLNTSISGSAFFGVSSVNFSTDLPIFLAAIAAG